MSTLSVPLSGHHHSLHRPYIPHSYMCLPAGAPHATWSRGTGEGHQGRSSIKAGQAEALATRAGRAVVHGLSVCLSAPYCRLYKRIYGRTSIKYIQVRTEHTRTFACRRELDLTYRGPGFANVQGPGSENAMGPGFAILTASPGFAKPWAAGVRVLQFSLFFPLPLVIPYPVLALRTSIFITEKKIVLVRVYIRKLFAICNAL